MEPHELPGPARDSDDSLTARKVEYDMADRGVVAPAWCVEDDVRIQQSSAGRPRVDDPGSDVDLLHVRRRDCAEGTSEPRVRRALFRYMESSASRFASVRQLKAA